MPEQLNKSTRWLIRGGLGLALSLSAWATLGDVIFQGREQIAVCGVGFGQPFVPPIQQAPTEQTQDGFVVAASGTALEDTPAGEALRLIDAGEWIKAIQAIESLSETDSKLVIDGRGVLRPLSAMKSALIASMPEDGRRAFRKLNDPSAKTKLDQANAEADFTKRAAILDELVNSYALCDASASAASELGDIRMMQGRFSEAAACYRFAAQHPATTADDAGLMARRLTALARAERWQAFDALAAYARFRHPATAVTIAGEDTPLVAFVSQLETMRTATPDDQPSGTEHRLAMPTEDEPDLSRRLIAEDHQKLLRMLAQNNNLAGVIDRIIAPIVATDGNRLYTSSLGSVAKIDPQTGTDLWRVGDANASIQQLQQRMYNVIGGFHQSLVLSGDALLAALPSDRNDLSMTLAALDAETGETKWDTAAMLRSQNEGVVGEPMIVGDRVYFATYSRTQALRLRVVRLSDGSEVGSVELGQASKGPRVQSPAELSPRLAMGQSHLVVQTNNGALIAIDPNDLAIAWAYTQKIRPSAMATMRHRGFSFNQALSRHTGEVVAIDGTVIAKDTRTNRVVAFREYDAALLWSAPCDGDATVVHYDDERVYVLGEELVALDLKTGQRVWWTPHAGTASGTPVFTEGAALIAGNHRLCRIDLTTGKLTDYREDLAGTRALHVVGDRLVGVGIDRLTAIPLPK